MSDNIKRAIEISAKLSKPVHDGFKIDEEYMFESNRNQLIAEQINDIRHYRELRKEYASKVFKFMCAWSGLMFTILLFKGFMGNCFELSDTVLVTLTGGTTVSVIGLVGFMMQGLFHSKNSKENKM